MKATRTISPTVAIIVNQNDAQHEPAARIVIRVEVEAEEGGRAELQHDREHGDERDQRLDLAVVRCREVGV